MLIFGSISEEVEGWQLGDETTGADLANTL